jgi:hypothetical protein
VPKLEVRVSETELASWRRAAGSVSLSRWVRATLDQAAAAPGPLPAKVRAAVAEAAAQLPTPAVVVPALHRRGRCRQHPDALPRIGDPSRCSWGCRLPDD